MVRWRALAAVVVRNLRLGARRPDLVVQAVAVPVVVLGLASVIFGASDAWPIAVVDQSRSSASAQVVEAIRDVHGATGPYFRVVETDGDAANDLVAEGRLHLVVTIPDDFPETRTLETTTYNINTDAMKNVRLRLAAVANLYDERAGQSSTPAEIVKRRPADVPRAAFMGGSAVILALLLGAAIVAANLYAVDDERRTTKEIALTPLGSRLAGLGAMVSGWLVSLVAALPTAGLALLMGTRTSWAALPSAALVVLPCALAAAGLGVACAAVLRTHRLVQPVIILLALATYFAGGGFMPVASLPPLARGLAAWWPPSYAFEWANPVLHGFTTGVTATVVTVVVAAAVAATAAAGWAGHREPSRAAQHHALRRLAGPPRPP